MRKVQIGRGVDTRFSVEESADNFFDSFSSNGENFVGKVKVDGEIVDDGSNVTVRGTISCRKKFICDRCLNQAEEDQLLEFDEELDESEIIDGFFDVTELVRDTLIAAQPIQNLCKPDCKGLCPNCGQNLNEGECSCSKSAVDPRLAALLNFKAVERF